MFAGLMYKMRDLIQQMKYSENKTALVQQQHGAVSGRKGQRGQDGALERRSPAVQEPELWRERVSRSIWIPEKPQSRRERLPEITAPSRNSTGQVKLAERQVGNYCRLVQTTQTVAASLPEIQNKERRRALREKRQMTCAAHT